MITSQLGKTPVQDFPLQTNDVRSRGTVSTNSPAEACLDTVCDNNLLAAPTSEEFLRCGFSTPDCTTCGKLKSPRSCTRQPSWKIQHKTHEKPFDMLSAREHTLVMRFKSPASRITLGPLSTPKPKIRKLGKRGYNKEQTKKRLSEGKRRADDGADLGGFQKRKSHQNTCAYTHVLWRNNMETVCMVSPRVLWLSCDLFRSKRMWQVLSKTSASTSLIPTKRVQVKKANPPRNPLHPSRQRKHRQ